MGFSDFFFFFDIVFSHKQKFFGSKQAPRYTGKRVILMRVLTRLECIYFFEVNTKYISSSELKTSKFSRVRCTSENLDVFKSRDEIYLAFTDKK